MKCQFDFEGKRKVFRHPIAIITTHHLDDVMIKMQEAEKALASGYTIAGFVSYEAASAFNSALQTRPSASTIPLLWFGVFTEHDEQEEPLGEELPDGAFDWKWSGNPTDYADHIQAIRNEIRQGNTYQVNYTTRLRSPFSGNPEAFYRQMRAAQQANYAAYLDIGDVQVLSASPELFFHWKDNQLTTRPMKGTARRGLSWEEDKEQRHTLAQSEKNRAENVMIVDLLRNDLGMIAKPGTVKVPELFTLEAYPTVWQMTSTITAEIEADIGLSTIFRALFPCGSVTGAPKANTMRIIADQEDSPRGIYCGAIGYATPHREACFSVPIRTLVVDKKQGNAEYGVGGAIVWDSSSEGEYDEICAKAALLTTKRPAFSLLESLRLEEGHIFRQERHLKRLARSAEYFGFTCDLRAIQQAWVEIAATYPKGCWKLRTLLSKDGEMHVEAAGIDVLSPVWTACLASESVNNQDPFLYHKTTHRTIYQRKQVEGFDETLLWNQHGELTEFMNGNLVLKIDGRYWTPPISCGLLAGTMRETLLAENTIAERVLTKKMLKDATEIYLINSVRNWVKIALTS